MDSLPDFSLPPEFIRNLERRAPALQFVSAHSNAQKILDEVFTNHGIWLQEIIASQKDATQRRKKLDASLKPSFETKLIPSGIRRARSKILERDVAWKTITIHRKLASYFWDITWKKVRIDWQRLIPKDVWDPCIAWKDFIQASDKSLHASRRILVHTWHVQIIEQLGILNLSRRELLPGNQARLLRVLQGLALAMSRVLWRVAEETLEELGRFLAANEIRPQISLEFDESAGINQAVLSLKSRVVSSLSQIQRLECRFFADVSNEFLSPPCHHLQNLPGATGMNMLDHRAVHSVAEVETMFRDFEAESKIFSVWDATFWKEKLEETFGLMKEIRNRTRSLPVLVWDDSFFWEISLENLHLQLEEKWTTLQLSLTDNLTSALGAQNARTRENFENAVRDLNYFHDEGGLQFVAIAEQTRKRSLPEMEAIAETGREVLDLLLKFLPSIPMNLTIQLRAATRMPHRLRSVLAVHEDKADAEKEKIEVELERRGAKLTERVRNLNMDLDKLWGFHSLNPLLIRPTIDKLSGLEILYKSFVEEKESLERTETIWDAPDLGQGLEKAELSLEKLKPLWSLALTVLNSQDSWFKSSIKTLEISEVKRSLKDWKETCLRLRETLATDTVQLNVLDSLESKIQKVEEKMPVLEALCNPGLQNHHWNEINSLLEIKQKTEGDKGNVSISELLSAQMDSSEERLEELSSMATKEQALRAALDRMKEDWKDILFEFLPYKATGVFVLSSLEDLSLLLESQLVRTQVMLTSPFVSPILRPVKLWLSRLHALRSFLASWKKCQSSWIYLEAIFNSEDIAYQIPEETRAFREVDKTWRLFNTQLVDRPRVGEWLEREEQPDLSGVLDLLQFVQKGFFRYLEKKRQAFSRFYFLSDDELLDLLSSSKDTSHVQKHITKLFSGIRRLTLDLKQQIVGFVGLEGEEISLLNPIPLLISRGHVEKWLSLFEEAVRVTLKNLLKEAKEGFVWIDSPGFLNWVFKWPPQIIQIVVAINITHSFETAISDGSLKGLQQKLIKWLKALSKAVRADDLSEYKRQLVASLITMIVERQSVIGELLERKVGSCGDIGWLTQFRHYSRDQGVSLQTLGAEFNYDFEFLGDFRRLVATPLTRKSHRIMAQAISQGLGSLLEGPAATGKTECVKELARQVGRQCIVFNCSEGLNIEVVGKLLKGMVSTGTWLCLDELNRLNLEDLSTIASHIIAIQQALSRGMSLLSSNSLI